MIRNLHAEYKAMSLVLVAVVAGVTVDSLTKLAGASLGTWQLLFLRWLFGFALYLPMALYRPAAVRWGRPSVHVIRLAISLVACYCLYDALTHLPLATCVTVFFAEPLFMLPLSAWLLNERVAASDWAAVVAGFIGVLIIARPGAGGLQAPVLVAVLGAVSFSFLHVMNKRWGRTESTGALMFWMALTMAIATAPMGLMHWRPVSNVVWLTMVLVAVSGFVYGVSWITAVKLGTVSRIAALSYLALPLSYLIGWRFFGEPLQAQVLAGSGVIVAAVVVVSRRNARRLEEPGLADTRPATALDAPLPVSQDQASARSEGVSSAGASSCTSEDR
ncbi:DMT family transporter [Mangrovitalea sediminis]|uniref:DMT family transporter n=1 Tax=Mangrovitalea sediminis TaxID=1982043 RepID=UPI0013043B9A|nr:DMT family transporter [Mangrovitalea sediminis]